MITELQTETDLRQSDYLTNLRETAAKVLASKGLPGNTHEDYKYLQADKAAYKLALAGAPKANQDFVIAKQKPFDAWLLTLINGQFAQALSILPPNTDQFFMGSLADALDFNPDLVKKIGRLADMSDGFVAKNTAEFTDGFVVFLGKNMVVEKPVFIRHYLTGEATFFENTRNLIIAGDNAQANIYKELIAEELSAELFLNSVTEVFCGRASNLSYSLIQKGTAHTHFVCNITATLDADSSFTQNNFCISGKLIRNNPQAILAGKGAEAHFNGVFLPHTDETMDNHTLMDHRVAHCPSNELYKGVILGKGTGVFNGKIFVRQDAQKTNAFQSNKNILLSDDGTIYTKPQLEIYADDVKCSHGSTTGQLDEKAMFYLRSRGISETAARTLLINAFAAEVTGSLKHESIRETIEEAITQKLNAA